MTSPTPGWTVEVDASKANATTKAPRQSWVKFKHLFLAVWVALFSLSGYYLISQYVVTAVQVQGRSMVPTLKDGERYFLNRIVFKWRAPERGDVVVIKDPGHSDYAVKRIVGLPGESLSLMDGAVYLNGARLSEPYLPRNTRTLTPDRSQKFIRVPQDRYFILGDNRGNSEDSRNYGAVHRSQIIGLISN
jgi:signal peptidase I